MQGFLQYWSSHAIGACILGPPIPLEIEWRGARYATGASIGLAMKTLHMADEKAWLQSADQACLEAKRQGRGQLLIG